MFFIRVLWSFCLTLFLLLGNGEAQAGELATRLANFPQWEKLTSVKTAKGDLVYPNWMSGTWQVTSTLVDLAAPLAPDIITPGFEGNLRQLNQPITFLVRFVKIKPQISGLKLIPKVDNQSQILVADRVFNSLNLSRAYLGNDAILSIRIDPESPNRQITFLRGKRQLVSIVTARATENTPDHKFITTEVFQQLFKGSSRPYFNIVESTTAYRQLSTSNPAIEADQVTAVYLSPQDPDYFTAGSRPVALYRYHLDFFPLVQPNTSQE
ncbi:hypothetical protein H6G54_16850 [Anabaena cylindrica FACHB-243]|uniref:DUF6816 domain-containing protein n=1 Tax=Anabaena cylindrica (strain ATCC 27899 / PCC 7122) TaxID=272123 RepID=K9ZGT3_ANACC|nr:MULTISPECIES: hypothetical protein [Anabaena]AFZ57752.1 hypothetical protein Anacy_2296 [Anabaena cylindrica PCC 7122]AZL96640.1 hypothetical protein [Anabaena sp. CCAP 1446/1C]MBD2419338.1 hypothetical protein [Anabaena cylindrica FACHB-243]MBY5282156.1 hypothetical protein [Anabaena sp. CCAP 1446/1C]MBY5307671.1 hypothetical protein [Anabaena sp. CCAP 1446/1C]